MRPRHTDPSPIEAAPHLPRLRDHPQGRGGLNKSISLADSQWARQGSRCRLLPGQNSMIPRLSPIIAEWVRSLAPSFERMLRTRPFTVSSLIESCAAISLLAFPSAIRRSTLPRGSALRRWHARRTGMRPLRIEISCRRVRLEWWLEVPYVKSP